MFEFILGLCVLFIVEYIGDFLLQSREMATNKSKDGAYLREHLVRIGLLISFGALILKLFGFLKAATALIVLVIPYLIIHGIQDWYIWKTYGILVCKKYEKDFKSPATEDYIKKFIRERLYAEDKMFYDFIGLDRLLHVLSMVILYGWLFISIII